MDFRDWVELWLLSFTAAFALLAAVFTAVLLYIR